MRPSLIIPRLRAQCPTLANRVAGSASYQQAMVQSDFAVPHAFVLLQGEDADGDVTLSDLDQALTARVGIVVCVSNTTDERGQAASETILDIRNELLTALVGWTPDLTKYGPILYRGMPDDPDVTRARAWAQFDFEALDFTANAA